MTARRLKILEDEMMNLRLSIEELNMSRPKAFTKPSKDRQTLLKLFGTWEGEIEPALDEFYARRERRKPI